MTRSYWRQMLKPDIPAPGSLWIERDFMIRPLVHIVNDSSARGVEMSLYVSNPRAPRQPSELIGLRDFHRFYVPMPVDTPKG